MCQMEQGAKEKLSQINIHLNLYAKPSKPGSLCRLYRRINWWFIGVVVSDVSFWGIVAGAIILGMIKCK